MNFRETRSILPFTSTAIPAWVTPTSDPFAPRGASAEFSIENDATLGGIVTRVCFLRSRQVDLFQRDHARLRPSENSPLTQTLAHCFVDLPHFGTGLRDDDGGLSLRGETHVRFRQALPLFADATLLHRAEFLEVAKRCNQIARGSRFHGLPINGNALAFLRLARACGILSADFI